MKQKLILTLIVFISISAYSINKNKFASKRLSYYDQIRIEQVEPVKNMGFDTSKYMMIETPIFLGNTKVNFLNETDEFSLIYIKILEGWINSHHPDIIKEYNLKSFNTENSIFKLIKENNKKFCVLINKELLTKIKDKGNKIYYIYIGGNLERTLFVVLDLD